MKVSFKEKSNGMVVAKVKAGSFFERRVWNIRAESWTEAFDMARWAIENYKENERLFAEGITEEL